MGASPAVAVSITGTGFNATAANNVVTFTPAAGSAATATATAVATLSAATGLRRSRHGARWLPVGTAVLRVLTWRPAKEAGKSLDIVRSTCPASPRCRRREQRERAHQARRTALRRGQHARNLRCRSHGQHHDGRIADELGGQRPSRRRLRGLRGVGVSHAANALRAQAFRRRWTLIGPGRAPRPDVERRRLAELGLTASDPDGDPVRLTVAGLPRFARRRERTATLS